MPVPAHSLLHVTVRYCRPHSFGLAPAVSIPHISGSTLSINLLAAHVIPATMCGTFLSAWA